MPKTPATVKLSIALMAFLAICWFVFGGLTVAGLVTTIPSGQIRLAFGIACLGCSVVIALAAYFLARRSRPVYFAAVFLMGMILMASFMDELGWTDATLIVITFVTLGLLIKDRAWFLQNPSR